MEINILTSWQINLFQQELEGDWKEDTVFIFHKERCYFYDSGDGREEE